ncbi:MAG: hypothetical protein Q4D66_00285 [Bacteroidales bacterium]|nr:hypothetical protein [Bacteroidales bacterium]
MRLSLSLLTLALLLLLGACETPSRRAISNIKTALKGKRYPDALRLVEAGRKDTLLMHTPKLYHLGLESSKKMYERENEKLYLRRAPDTTALFRTLYHVYEYALLVDSIEQERKKATAPSHYRKALAETMNASFSNLNAASLYFVRKQNWQEVIRFSELALEARNSPVFEQHIAKMSDSLGIQFAWRHLLACHQSKQYQKALRYAPQALKDTVRRATALEMLTNVQIQLGHQQEAIAYLQKGVEEYPHLPFFFMTLSELYFQQNRPDSVLAMTEKLLKNDSTNFVLYEERARAYHLLGEYEQSAQAAEAMIRSNGNHAQGHYYKGYAALQMAREVMFPLSIHSPGYRTAHQKQRNYYKQAQKSLETYRRLAPENNKIWAPLLYDVYLKLNLGKEFEEISNYLPQ